MAFEWHLHEESNEDTVNSDGKFVKRYTRIVWAKSTVDMTLDAVKAAIGTLPGAPHPDWPSAICNKISNKTRLTKAPKRAWVLEYGYATDAIQPESTSDPDPTLMRVLRDQSPMEQQRFIIKDRNGVLITDAAGSAFDGGVPVTDFLGQFIWERNELHTSTSFQKSRALTGYLNSDTYLGCAPGTLQLKVTGKERYEGNYHFWAFRYEMTYDRFGHQPKPANAGLYEKKGGKRVRIQEDSATGGKQDTLEPQPLYSASNLVPGPGRVIPVASRPAACNFIDVDHFPTMAFSTLMLPIT